MTVVSHIIRDTLTFEQAYWKSDNSGVQMEFLTNLPGDFESLRANFTHLRYDISFAEEIVKMVSFVSPFPNSWLIYPLGRPTHRPSLGKLSEDGRQVLSSYVHQIGPTPY